MLQTLQAGRGLAASAVAAFHLSIMMGEPRYGGERVFGEYVSRGNLGVDFFFVLSGFIMLFAHEKDIGRPGRWREYARRRFVRLYPVYWLYTAVFVVAVLALGSTVAKVPTGWADMAGWISLVRFSAVEAPLPVAWSLFHEVLFYVLFLLLILNKRVGLAAFFVWAVLCLAMFHPIGEGPPTPLSAYTALCNLWFFFGMGAYLLFKRMASGMWAAVAGAGVLAVSAFMDLDHVLWPFLLVTGLALLVAGAARMEAAGRLRCPAWLAFIGNASYSIYLLHESISGALLKAAIKTGATSHLSGEAIFILVLAATIALGCVAYVAIEKPLLRILSRRATGRAGPSTSGAAPARWTGARRT